MSQHQSQYGAQTRKTDEYGNPVNQVDQYGNPISGGGLTSQAGRQHFGTTGATGHGHGHQQHHRVDQTTGYGTQTGGVTDYGINTGSGYGSSNVAGTGYGGAETTEYLREEHHVQYGDRKGLMDKIKEKIPGTEQSRTNVGYGTGYGTTGYGASGVGTGTGTGTAHGGTESYVREERHVLHGDHPQHVEKKGVMDKIKEKIPGTEQSRTNVLDGAGYGTGIGTGTGYGTTGYGASGVGTGIGHGGTESYMREERHVLHGDQLPHGEKKGVMDKIKEKLPGTEHSNTNVHGTGYGTGIETGTGYGTTGYGYGASGGGIGGTGREYVKEEQHVKHGAGGGGIGGTGQEYVREEHHVHHGDKKHGASGGIGGTGKDYVKEEHHVKHGAGEEYVREEHRVQHGEKKGLMEKIKEKLPGSGRTGH